MKRPIFIDCTGQPYFEDAYGDLRDHRGQLLGLVHEANIRAVLRMMNACKTTRPDKRLHSMDDGSESD